VKKSFAACGGRILYWSCVKRFFLALYAKLNFDGDIFFLILLRKIRKKMSPSKEYFAAATFLHNLIVGGHLLLEVRLSVYKVERIGRRIYWICCGLIKIM
jgi:hypothetical protein